jgi:phosphatidylinositol alpha-1,6-mannosyltransferase
MSGVDGPYLLALGRLDDLHKGQDVAVEAMNSIAGVHPRLTLVIAGDGGARPDLEERATRLGIADRVRFLGRVSDTDKESLLAHAEALLLLSRLDARGRFEGFGIVVLEAALYGVPAIVSSVGGLPEAVDHEATGLVVDPDDVGTVVSAIKRILDKDEAARLGAAARKRATEQFVWPARRAQVRALIVEAGRTHG